MVMLLTGLSAVRNWGRKVVDWLENGGRERIYSMARDLESRYQQEALLGDFSCYIALPTDVILYYRHRDRDEGLFYTFQRSETETARQKATKWNRQPEHPEYEAKVLTGAEHFGLREDQVFTDFVWHGYAGTELIFQAIEDLIKEQTGERVIL
jgi:hypothetical protein